MRSSSPNGLPCRLPAWLFSIRLVEPLLHVQLLLGLDVQSLARLKLDVKIVALDLGLLPFEPTW